MDDETTKRIIEGLRRLPPPPPGFSILDLVTVQPMTLPVSDLDLEFVEGPIPNIQE